MLSRKLIIILKKFLALLLRMITIKKEQNLVLVSLFRAFRRGSKREEAEMPEEFRPGCQRPKSGPVGGESAKAASGEQTVQEEKKPMIKVGQKAPDFSAAAYHKGKFIEVKLSEYIGKWVVLCFYPGDFTFV